MNPDATTPTTTGTAAKPAEGRAPGETTDAPRHRLPCPPARPEMETAAVSPRQPALALLALLVHQISQPVTALLGEVELALLRPSSAQELKAALERCFRSLELVVGLLHDFRELGEVNEAAVSESPLVTLVNTAVEIQKETLEARGCEINRQPIRNGCSRKG